MQVRVIDNITKVFPNMIEVKIFKKPLFVVTTAGSVKRSRCDVGDVYEPTVTSLARTRTLVKDLVRANRFELFCTFTFDKRKIDRYSYAECNRAMRLWLHHQKNRSEACSKRFEYIVVPEQHKDGAWHFHALIKGYCGTIRPSGCVSSSGRMVYNLTSYRSGFTTAVHIDNHEAVSNYIIKYISKSFVKQFNRRRFTCSRGLVRPIREINSSRFSRSLPLQRHLLYTNSEVEGYSLDLW